MPRLLAVRGCRAVLNRHRFVTPKTVGRWGGFRINSLEWESEYYLDQPPTAELPLLADPVAGFDGAQP